MNTKLMSVRVDEEILEYLDALSRGSVYYNRSFWINKMLEFGVALCEQNQSKIFRDFCRCRGDKILINDYDITKGDFSNLKK